jgi:hypothetical protein
MASTSPLRMSRYHFFSAEQPMTIPARPIPPSALDTVSCLSHCSLHVRSAARQHGFERALEPLAGASEGSDDVDQHKASDVPVERISASQGSLSSSVRGMPFDIFSTLDLGCNESPSMNGMRRASATCWPMVDFPLRVSRGTRVTVR